MSDLFTYAQQQRDAGIAQAVKHADESAPGWSDRALDWIRRYARAHSQFISEDCTAAAAAEGFISAADPRAWGAPFKRAAKQGVIRKIGYGVSRRRHLSPCPLWESLL